MKKTYLVLISLFFSLTLHAEWIDTTSNEYTFNTNESIAIQVHDLSSNANYWMAIYPKNKNDNWWNATTWPSSTIKNGTVNFYGITTPGTYQARLFYKNTYTRIDTVEFNIQSQGNQGDCGTPWRASGLTTYESYPSSSQEGNNFNGYEYAGMFALLGDEVKSRDWVKEHDIVAVHSKDWDWLAGKTLRIRQNGKTISAKVYDMCKDSDAENWWENCTNNQNGTDYFLDLESFTYAKSGFTDDENVEFQVCY